MKLDQTFSYKKSNNSRQVIVFKQFKSKQQLECKHLWSDFIFY